MLKIAKNALTGALEESAGKPSGMATSLIRELASVNPLSQVCVFVCVCVAVCVSLCVCVSVSVSVFVFR